MYFWENIIFEKREDMFVDNMYCIYPLPILFVCTVKLLFLCIFFALKMNILYSILDITQFNANEEKNYPVLPLFRISCCVRLSLLYAYIFFLILRVR